jgi:ADP-ribose pyrophosphatase
MVLFEKTLDEKSIYKGKIIDLVVQNVELLNGRISKREIVKHPGGVAILAYLDDETILFVEQFRKPIDNSLLELPAGKLEYGENTKECGIRELEEETGYKAKKFEYLGKIVTSPGFTNEYIYIYKASELYKGQTGLGDEDEFINIHEIKVNDIKSMIKKGDIIDSKTICAFMMI